MRNRKNRVVFYLSDDELAALNRRVQKSALSREAYLRQLINGLVPHDAPPPDYYGMMRELYHIGNNVRADAIEQVVTLELRRMAEMLRQDEAAFAEMLAQKTDRELTKERKRDEEELQKSIVRNETVSRLYEKLYEDI